MDDFELEYMQSPSLEDFFEYSVEESIIDVSNFATKIETSQRFVPINISIPKWDDEIIYKFEQLNTATSQQQNFYQIFKTYFFRDLFVNLASNDNYAMILFFELRDRIKIEINKSMIERYLLNLGIMYPCTRDKCNEVLNQHNSTNINYFLLNKNVVKAPHSIENSIENSIEKQKSGSYERTGNDGNAIISEDGNLLSEEVFKHESFTNIIELSLESKIILNRIVIPENNFNANEFCRFQILNLFQKSIQSLKIQLINENIGIDHFLRNIAVQLVQNILKIKANQASYKINVEKYSIYLIELIYIECENAVREKYFFTKLAKSNKQTLSIASMSFLEKNFTSKMKSIIQFHLDSIPECDNELEIYLNQMDSSRWRAKYNQIVRSFKNNPIDFQNEIIQLFENNKSNLDICTMMFEASVFVAKSDKNICLSLYSKYLELSYKQFNTNFKSLPHELEKYLFENKEQGKKFWKILFDLRMNSKLEQAINSILSFYAPVRKTISLDKNSIQEVKKAHLKTVSVLNEYLADDDTIEEFIQVINPSTKAEQIKQVNSENERKIELKNGINLEKVIEKSIDESIDKSTIFANKSNFTLADSEYKFLSEITLNQNQIALLQLFESNNFTLSFNQVKEFAKSKKLFKNQLIESINDKCFDFIDDNLIEEELDGVSDSTTSDVEEEIYSINPKYFKQIQEKE
jgi:hypothetical protein